MMRPPVAACAGLLLAACASSPAGPPVLIRYVGSSTIGNFLRDAERVYRAAEFDLNTAPESEGGERAILRGETALAGSAKQPGAAIARAGLESTLIGRDAIAVVVHADNPVRDLSRAELRRLFTGQATDWSELGGAPQPVVPFIVGERSATRAVFRAAVLDGADYRGCREVEPDAAIVRRVAETAGGIGQISFSFLAEAAGVRAIAVDGEEPSVTNFDYPIARPLHLLWRRDDPAVAAFVRWARSREGQRVVMRQFVGVRVVGSVGDDSQPPATGTLVVLTETYRVYDGGIYYYPHRPYELLTRHGEPIRRVPNHRSKNDERPMRIALAPGTYLIRPETAARDRPELFVTVEAGKVTEVDVAEHLRRGRR